jgi:hypothetical protein
MVMINEEKNWRMVEDLKWKSDHNYNRISLELSNLDEGTFQELKRFVNKKANKLYKEYQNSWLGNDGGPGIDVGDDSWSDLIYDVVGRGEDFYNSITTDKLREMGNKCDFEESFIYCFLK